MSSLRLWRVPNLLQADLRFPLFTRSRRNGKPGSWFSGSLLCIILIVLCCSAARAETFKAPDPGRGWTDVTGTWQFHTGDDLAWANPSFDDSGWQAISADQPWGAQGHAGYRGYAWYRKRIEIGPGDSPLALRMWPADGAYEVYWNGTEIGASGSLPPTDCSLRPRRQQPRFRRARASLLAASCCDRRRFRGGRPV